ncbi:hypothetical protein A9Q84_13285 [Halobacteriovorax marinus]|uniref:PBP domain-containing protein n=1 Tax=Halobacteriovorax marinus TaxID=97084 RepID=A0A1Y5F8T8_9BACT|nr:hypothetical protein A9Q84_13285 [Halobacteriovorax marinus]
MFLVFSLAFSLSSLGAEFFVLSSKNLNTESVNKEVVKSIFLGNKLYWESGKRILPVHLPVNNKSFRFFLEEVIDMDANQFLSYWRRRLFSGRAHPPKQLAKDDLIIEYIKNHPEGIGVISKAPAEESEDVIVIEI